MPDRRPRAPIERRRKAYVRKRRKGSDLRISCESRLRRFDLGANLRRLDMTVVALGLQALGQLICQQHQPAQVRKRWSCKSRAILRRSVSVSFASCIRVSASAELVLASRLFCRCAHHIATSANVNNIDSAVEVQGNGARATANSKRSARTPPDRECKLEPRLDNCRAAGSQATTASRARASLTPRCRRDRTPRTCTGIVPAKVRLLFAATSIARLVLRVFQFQAQSSFVDAVDPLAITV